MYGWGPRLRLFAALALLAWSAAPPVRAGEVDDRYAVAAGLYAEQRYEAAVGDFRKLLADFPEHPLAASARFFLAESLLQTGEYDAAATEFGEFVASHPQHRFAAQASFRIGESAYLRGDYQQALPKLQAFVATHGNHKLCEYALPYLADCQLEQKDLAAAQANYQQALKAFPAGALTGECRLGLARVAEEQGDVREAQRFYEFVAQRNQQPLADDAKLRLGRLLHRQRDFTSAIPQLEPLAKQSTATPQRTAARYWLGHALTQQKQAAAAQKWWQQAIDEDPTHELAPAMAMALAESFAAADKLTPAREWCERIDREWRQSSYADDALALETHLALEAGQFAEVTTLARSFAERYAQSPLAPQVHETHGRALLAQQKFAEACEVFAPLAANASPEQAHLPYALALAQLGAKQFDAALATLAKIDPKAANEEVQAGVLATQGSALVALGRGQEALAPLKQYIAEHADGLDATKCRAQLCVAYAQAQQFAEAQTAWQALQKHAAKDPTFLPTTLYLAEAAAEAGQQSAAQTWFEFLAQEQHPQATRDRAVAGLAWLAQQAGTPAAANTQLDKVLAKQPKSPQAAELALRRAQNFEQAGEHDNALAAYLAWAKEYPDAEQLPEALFGAARVHDHLNQDREALALLERLLKDHDDYPRKDAALYQIAWVLLDLDRRDEAAGYFAKLHDDHRESVYWSNATYRLADHRVRNKRYEEAAALLDELLAATTDAEMQCYALYLQGQAAASAQKWDQVAAPLERLLAEHERHELRPLAEYWLAEADYRTGKLREAGARLADLSTRLAGRNDDWLPMVPLRQAQVLAHEQRWQEAHDLAATIAEKYPNFRQQYEVDYLLGRALGALAKFEAARAAYDRVVQSPIGGRTETAAMAQWMIGETYFQQEKYDEAIAAYHRVERLFGFERWQAAAILQAGKCHEAKGRYRDAMQMYAQLLKQHAQTSFATEASQRLRVAQQRAANVSNRLE